MSLYATLEEAIEAAREDFIDTAEGGNGDEPPVPQQFNLQKYVMLDGDIMWQAEFFEEEGEAVECLTLRSGAAAQAIFDGDYDEVEITAEWIDENTLYEWEEGDFLLEPPPDTEEGQAAPTSGMSAERPLAAVLARTRADFDVGRCLSTTITRIRRRLRCRGWA